MLGSKTKKGVSSSLIWTAQMGLSSMRNGYFLVPQPLFLLEAYSLLATPTLQYFECRGLRKLNKHKKRQTRKQGILRGWRLLLNQKPQAESKFDKQNKCEIVNSYFINLNPN
uniref:Uncharacterized protein n=1 Tax=Opuntia streptacantha TaxID=393608 RepID=A0A7C8YEJ7_OPUST